MPVGMINLSCYCFHSQHRHTLHSSRLQFIHDVEPCKIWRHKLIQHEKSLPSLALKKRLSNNNTQTDSNLSNISLALASFHLHHLYLCLHLHHSRWWLHLSVHCIFPSSSQSEQKN